MFENKGIAKYFGRQVDPKELVRKWRRTIKTEIRSFEKQIRDLDRTEKKAKGLVKEAVKENNMTAARVLAKEVVNTQKTRTQCYNSRAQMHAMDTALVEQLAVAKVAGTLEKSTLVMESMGKLLKIPELAMVAQNLSKEMMKAGVIGEMVSEAIECAVDSEDLEQETENAVDKILKEVTGETLAELPKTKEPAPLFKEKEQEAEAEEEADIGSLQNRLNAIRN